MNNCREIEMNHGAPRRWIRHCAVIAAALGAGGGAAWAAGPQVHDVVIRNAVIYDGSGTKPYAGEIAIDGDRIAYVGVRRALAGRSEIDAHGQAVAPGIAPHHFHALRADLDFRWKSGPICGVVERDGSMDGTQSVSSGA